MLAVEDLNKVEAVYQKIKESQKILLVSHINPDIDAVASISFFIEILKQENKKFLAFAEGKGDDYYFLAHEDQIISSKDELAKKINLDKDFLRYFDLIIVLDCGSLGRTSLEEEITNIKDLMLDTFVVEIDHHVPDKSYANIEIKIPLSSTTEILYHVAKTNNIEINRNLANCILAGILTDTANFMYPSTSSDTIKIAAEMMAQGAQFPKLLNHTWRNKSLAEMKLWGLALSNLKINEKYNIAFSVLPYNDIKDLKGSLGADIFGDIAGFLSSLSEADITLLLREDSRGKIKGSLRVGASNNQSLDVNKLARLFGGGGHKKASGFMVEGSIIKKDNLFKVL